MKHRNNRLIEGEESYFSEVRQWPKKRAQKRLVEGGRGSTKRLSFASSTLGLNQGERKVFQAITLP